MKHAIVMLLIAVIATGWPEAAPAGYPYDGYTLTGIRRLERLRMIIEGAVDGPKLLPGQQKALADIRLNLTDERGTMLSGLPAVDADLQKELDALFPNRHESYAVAIMDITPGSPIRYAERQGGRQFAPGSVGKLAVAAGLFAELQRLFPNAPEQRRNLLRGRMVKGEKWVITDSHTIPVYDPETKHFVSRPPQETDVFSLYEWTDHMLSASANAAASVVWKEIMLMRVFDENYPPTEEQEQAFWTNTPKKDLTPLVMSVVNDPLRSAGIAQRDWQLGSMFTNMGKNIAPGAGGSTATPRGMMQFLTALEKGQMVDAWSSLELKRMMYMTARRIRYASAPVLENAAVYFKSGSQYKCKEEPGFVCKKYHGNVDNYMNSVAIIEHPDGRTYLVALMSNVLKKNSAVEHQSLAVFIDRMFKP